MDYSYALQHTLLCVALTDCLRLLLGIDTEHKQIACGLVDTIGPYLLQIQTDFYSYRDRKLYICENIRV